MPPTKRVLCAQRVRHVPRAFSWIDHRLVRNRHIEKCSRAQLALYLFLICVSDEKGPSFYGDKAIISRLSMDQQTLNQSRIGLINHSLIARQKPVYQVLCLESVQKTAQRGNAMMSLGDIFKAAVEVEHD